MCDRVIRKEMIFMRKKSLGEAIVTRKTTLGELIANAVSHGIGAMLAIAALVLLIVKADTVVEILSSIAFGVSMIVLYLSSTLLHSFPDKMTTVKDVFRRFDHSSIFILIAGTYTPFLVLAVGTTQGYILLIGLWVVTIIGIIFKAIWAEKYMAVSVVIYLLMGWSFILVSSDVFSVLGNEIIFLVIGGLSYTVGVLFFISKFKYSHFVWHIFVLGGTFFHFICVYGYLL